MALLKTGLLILTLLVTEPTLASAEEVVDSFHQALISAMKAESQETRKSIIENAIKS